MDARERIISAMDDSLSRDARLALDLALTVRHDGHGGVADDLAEPTGLTAWVRAHPDVLPGSEAYVADDLALIAARDLRAAVRALFARAVRPAEPSPADAARLLPVPEAVARLNAAAARTPTVPVLAWPDGADPVVRQEPQGGRPELTAVLMRRRDRVPREPRSAAPARLPRAALRALLPQGAPASGVVQGVVREPRPSCPPPRAAQEVRVGRGRLPGGQEWSNGAPPHRSRRTLRCL